MNHTPGPWKILRFTTHPHLNIASPDRRICDMVDYHDGQEYRDADLISAAPDLLAACRAAIEALAEATARYGFNCTSDTRIIRSAILKAEGKSTGTLGLCGWSV